MEDCPVDRVTGIHCTNALLPEGWRKDVRIEIAGGRIAKVEESVPAKPDDEAIACMVPGMGNLHSHAFQRGMAGLAERRGPEDDSFWTWREVMYRFVGTLSPEDLEAIAAQAYVEMLEGGFTRVGEFHYLHHDPSGGAYSDIGEMSGRIAAAAERTGLGLTLLPVFYAQGGFGGKAPGAAQARFISNPDFYGRLVERCRAIAARLEGAVVGIAPHSLRAVSPEQLAAILPVAGDGPIHIHIAEQMKEVEDCLAWSGQRPVEWLLAHAPVDHRWCFVHATHMTETETKALARSGAVAGLCPITEANLGDGLFPLETFQQSGGVYGVGSDSNVRIDMPEELRLLEYGQRLLRRARNVGALGPGRSTGRDLFEQALRGGAQALGTVAGIETGHSADLVSLAADHREDDGLDQVIFAQGRVSEVWSQGRRRVSQGRHLSRDEVAVRFKATLKKVLAR
jgi:formiminoglutamate deiminase